MDTKFLVRIGAAIFVGLAIAITLLQWRAGPASTPPEKASVPGSADDPLAMQLRNCAAIGEQALEDAGCRAAWAEKRRRFFGVDHPAAYSGFGKTAQSVTEPPAAQQPRGED